MSVSLCPCCKQPLPDAFADLEDKARLTRQERALFRVVANANGRNVAAASIIETLYGHDADGGPLTANQVIRALIMRANRKMAPLNYRILNTWGVGYRLVGLESAEVPA